MANGAAGGLFCLVELNCNGVFRRNPFSYVNGLTYLIDDHDFSSQTYAEFVTWIEHYMQETVRHVYYCEPEKPMEQGLQAIENDIDYSGFIFDAYGTDGKISVYVDHHGQGIEEWFNEELEAENDNDSCILGEEDEEVVEKQKKGNEGDSGARVKMNRTADDPFLNKLCSKPVVDDLQDGVEAITDPPLQVHAVFNAAMPWKKQKPVLGMKFQDPGQLKSMLCNYAVANGYQLCFERNDRKRLLVKCCKGDCPFRLWASWMSDEETFQIKSLVCYRIDVRVFDPIWGSLNTATRRVLAQSASLPGHHTTSASYSTLARTRVHCHRLNL